MKKINQIIAQFNHYGLIFLAPGVLLVFAQCIYLQRFSYVFLLWNLFLAYLPFLFSLALDANRSRWFNYTFMAGWLLFFPNAPYLVTDFIHLHHRFDIPYWFDLAMLTIFSLYGMYLGMVSLINVQRFVAEKYGLYTGWVLVCVSLVLGSYGIFLGRVLRYNSWDVLCDPFGLFRDMTRHLTEPYHYKEVYLFTFIFTVLLSVIFLMFKKLYHAKD